MTSPIRTHRPSRETFPNRSWLPNAFFVICFIGVLYLVVQILRPFIVPIIWAALLVTAFHPVYIRLVASLRGRRRTAAVLSCVLVTGIIVVPMLLLAVTLAKESVDAYNRVQSLMQSPEFDSRARLIELREKHPILQTVGQFLDMHTGNIRQIVLRGLEMVQGFLVGTSRTIVSGFADFIFKFLLTLVTMFFFFVDGRHILQRATALLPMQRRYAQRVIRRFQEVSVAALYGSVLTAVGQGFVGAISFMLVGLPSPVLWGAVMAFASFVPLFGTALVWFPVVVYFLLSGSYGKAIALFLIGSLVINSVDNIVKLVVIQGRIRMHTLLVFFSILGGLRAFGFLGLFLGPLIMAIFLTFLDIYEVEFRDQLSRPRTGFMHLANRVD
jgi:predicted PurR-regulated permease PerM